MRKKELSFTLVFLLMFTLEFSNCEFFRVQKFRNRSGTRLQVESRRRQKLGDLDNRNRVKLPDERRIEFKEGILNNLRRNVVSPITKRVRDTLRSFDDNNRQNRRVNRENRNAIGILGVSRESFDVNESQFRKMLPESLKSEQNVRSTLNIDRRIKPRTIRIMDGKRSQNSKVSPVTSRTRNSRNDHRDMLFFAKDTLLRQAFRFSPNYGRETDRKTFRSNSPFFVSENRRKVQTASRNSLLSKRSSDLKRNSFEFQSRILAREIAREREGVMMKTKRELKILYETSKPNGKSNSLGNWNREVDQHFPNSRYKRQLNAVSEERISEQRISRRQARSKNSNLRETQNIRVFGFDKSRRDVTLLPNSHNKFGLFKYARKSGRISRSVATTRASRKVDATLSRDNPKNANYQIRVRENIRIRQDNLLNEDSIRNTFREKSLRKNLLLKQNHERVFNKAEKLVRELTQNKYSVRDSRIPTIISDVHRIVQYSRNIPNTQRYGLPRQVSHKSVFRRPSTDTLNSKNKRLRSLFSEEEFTNRQTVRNTRNNLDTMSLGRIRFDTRSANRRFLTVLKQIVSTSRNIDQRQEIRNTRNSERNRRTSERNLKLVNKKAKDEAFTFRKTSDSAENDVRSIRLNPIKHKLSSRRLQTRDQSTLSPSSKLETDKKTERLRHSPASSRSSRIKLEENTDSFREDQRNVRSKLVTGASRIIRSNRLGTSESLRVSPTRKLSDQNGRITTALSSDRNVNKMNSRFVEPIHAIKYSTTSSQIIGKEQEKGKGSSLYEIIKELFHHMINRDNKYISFGFDAVLGLAFLVFLMDEPNKGLFSRFRSHFDSGFRVFQNLSIKI